MPRHTRRDPMFRYRRHQDEIIVLAVRWYISYRLSLRDLVEMLAVRGVAAAKAFFRKALASSLPRVPRKVTLDGHRPSRSALWRSRREHTCWRNVTVRTNKYLNNIVEQDHRAVKRRYSAMHGLKSFGASSITLAGAELAHRIRKRQFALGHASGRRRHTMQSAWDRALFGI